MRRIAWTPRLIVPLLGLTIGILLGMDIKGFVDDVRTVMKHGGSGFPVPAFAMGRPAAARQTPAAPGSDAGAATR